MKIKINGLALCEVLRTQWREQARSCPHWAYVPARETAKQQVNKIISIRWWVTMEAQHTWNRFGAYGKEEEGSPSEYHCFAGGDP